jgi:hypothetical protein
MSLIAQDVKAGCGDVKKQKEVLMQGHSSVMS